LKIIPMKSNIKQFYSQNLTQNPIVPRNIGFRWGIRLYIGIWVIHYKTLENIYIFNGTVAVDFT
ncbi:MAG: hypothetical protein L3J83_02395, partial [Proteobacteria bacterium]|nr:hypothetical protein [Pseudomonadota bacterium]